MTGKGHAVSLRENSNDLLCWSECKEVLALFFCKSYI